jgi:hypothetical protein
MQSLISYEPKDYWINKPGYVIQRMATKHLLTDNYSIDCKQWWKSGEAMKLFPIFQTAGNRWVLSISSD